MLFPVSHWSSVPTGGAGDVAYDASTKHEFGSGNFSFNHATAITPAGVLIFTLHPAGSNHVTAVEYGGINVPAVSGGEAADSGGELGFCKAWFLGSGLPASDQTVEIFSDGTTDVQVFVVTVDCAGDTQIHTAGIVLIQDDGTLAEQNVDDGSPGFNSVRFGAIASGLNALPSAGANSTSIQTIDDAVYCYLCVRETTAGQGSRPIGWSSGNTDDRAAVLLAVCAA